MYHGFAFFLLPVDGLGVGGLFIIHLATIRIGIANKSHSMIAIYPYLFEMSGDANYMDVIRRL
jgi:hypothetical protein